MAFVNHFYNLRSLEVVWFGDDAPFSLQTTFVVQGGIVNS